MDEAIILECDKVFRWEGPKRKQTLAHAKLGRLVLTERRLLFLSTGKNDINLRRIGGAALTPLAALSTGKTSHLDLEAVHADGGLDIAVEHLRSAELTSMFKVLTISWDTGGGPIFSTFAPKNGGMPDGSLWVDALRRMIGDADADRPAAAATVSPVAVPASAHEPSASSSAGSEFPPPMDAKVPAAPSRPGTAVAGFRNPDRLAATVEDLTRRFGVAILDDPSRVRNLLRDDYGVDATRDRSDIDTFVSVLEHHPLSALDQGRSQGEVASDLSRVTSIDEPGAMWTLSVLQKARPVVSDPTVLDAKPAPSAPGGLRGPSATLVETTDRRASSGRSRAGVLIAVVGALGLAAALGAWFAGRASLDDWKQRALAAEAQVESNDTEQDQEDGDTSAPAATLPELSDDADTDELQAAYEAAAAEVAALTADRDQLTQAVETRQAKVVDLRDRLAEAKALLAAQTQPFVATPRHLVGEMDGTGELVECVGFSGECSATYYLFGSIVKEGTQRFFESPDMVRVPITTPDGYRWTGQAEITGAYGGFTCNDQRSLTTFSINMLPAEYRVNPASQRIDVISYDVDFTRSTPDGDCTSATSTYRGRFTFR